MFPSKVALYAIAIVVVVVPIAILTWNRDTPRTRPPPEKPSDAPSKHAELPPQDAPRPNVVKEPKPTIIPLNSTFISAKVRVLVLWNLDSSSSWKPTILELKKQMLEKNTGLIADLESSSQRLQSYCNLPAGDYVYCMQGGIGEIPDIPQKGIYRFTFRSVSTIEHSITLDDVNYLKGLLDARYGYTLSGGNSYEIGYYGFAAYNATKCVINIGAAWSVP